MTYRCNKSFKCWDGKFYYYGEKINDSHYALLTDLEKRNFSKIEIEETSFQYPESSLTVFPDTQQSNFDTPSFGMDFNSDSTNDSSFDYGSGDTGGAGSSGDY